MAFPRLEEGMGPQIGGLSPRIACMRWKPKDESKDRDYKEDKEVGPRTSEVHPTRLCNHFMRGIAGTEPVVNGSTTGSRENAE